MRIHLYCYFDENDRYSSNTQMTLKMTSYWKIVLKTLMLEHSKLTTSFADKDFRDWLLKNWGIELKIRLTRRKWIEKLSERSLRIKYVHDIVIPEENLSMLLLKFPTTLFSNREENGNNL